MGGYRTIKRFLGETSLERKSRFLFGACLVLLIGGAFWWVGRIAEDVAGDATRSRAHNLIAFRLLTHHAGAWRLSGKENDATRDMARETMEFIVTQQGYDYAVLRLGGKLRFSDLKSKTPSDPGEHALLQKIKRQYDAWIKRQRALRKASGIDLLGTKKDKVAYRPDEPIFADRIVQVGKSKQFQFYEPVYWHPNCQTCHQPIAETGVLSASQAGVVDEESEQFRVMKVSIPYQETQDAIDRARAILIAVGILTVFVAMVALYVIFRYVVVKPLHHLREVSELVSKGDMEIRAEIHTGDEFEQLAESFNRMLRHLTDAQSELRAVNAELDARVDEMAKLNMELHEMNRLKSDFLTNMSHELRTPLNSIIGFASVLKEIDALNDKQKRYAANIEHSGHVLLEMINEILDLARVEAGKMEVHPTEFAIDPIVRGQCGIMRSLCEQKQIDLSVEVPPDLPLLFQDQAKIQQILTNLLSNAVKFTPDGGRIMVSARMDHAGRLVLSVQDTGVGIPEEDRELIFEKFRQSTMVSGKDGLTRKFSGSGLGLSLVRELCHLLGGEIDFVSEVGKGTTFFVRLPWRCPDPADAPAAGAEVTPSR